MAASVCMFWIWIGLRGGREDEAAGVDEDIGGLGDLWTARTPIDHPGRGGGNERADFLRRVGDGDVEHTHPGVLPGGEDQRRGDERAGPVLVQIVWAEVRALARRRQRFRTEAERVSGACRRNSASRSSSPIGRC